MSNNVISEVIFDRPASEHAPILAAALNADGKIDFNGLIPKPAHVWQGSVGAKHMQAFGAQNIGLDWARLNWGTKWNAYSSQEPEALADRLILRFQTAWSPPYPWLIALFNTFGAFTHNWLDEGASRARSGRFYFRESWGPEWDEVEVDDVLHRHLHKLLWGVEEFADEDA